MRESIEHPKGSEIVINRLSNFMTTAGGKRKAFGTSWLATIPAKITHGKGRRRKQFASLEDAKEWADTQHRHLKIGSGYLELNDRERAEAVSAFHMARDAKLSLSSLVADAIAAVKFVGTSEKLPEAARFFQERKGRVKATPVVDAIDQLLREKEQDGISAAHSKDLRLRLNHFAGKFGGMNVNDLDAQHIDGWLRDLDVGKRSRVNYRRVVLTFLRFCERRGWLARGAIDSSAISSPKVKSNGPIGIFKPEELRVMLEKSSAKLRPYFVLGGLCGLRTAESLRLDWSEIDFTRNTITIEADKAKTASRRIVPLCPAAKEWLLPLQETSGRILPYHHVAKEVVRFLDRLKKEEKPIKLEWQSNGLRHTYVSARMAILKDANKVALECGNSPAMVFSNYRELMHEETATEWFALVPAKSGQTVIRFPKAAGE